MHIMYGFQDNYNALHIASMFSREDVVKLLLSKKGVDVYAPGGVSLHSTLSLLHCKTKQRLFWLQIPTH